MFVQQVLHAMNAQPFTPGTGKQDVAASTQNQGTRRSRRGCRGPGRSTRSNDVVHEAESVAGVQAWLGA
jgi:hypothetical protein